MQIRQEGEWRKKKKAIQKENISPGGGGGADCAPRHSMISDIRTTRSLLTHSLLTPLPFHCSSFVLYSHGFLTAYGGLQSAPAVLAGKHSPGHNVADKTRHLLVLLKQDRTICSSARILHPPDHHLLKSFFIIPVFGFFLLVRFPRHRCGCNLHILPQNPSDPPPAPFHSPINTAQLWRHPFLIWDACASSPKPL